MNCSHCNQVLAASAKFCNHCGTAQQPAPALQPAVQAQNADKVCDQCQALCKPQAKFCLQCGHRFAPAADTVAAPAQAAQAPLFEAVEPAAAAPAFLPEPPAPPAPVAAEPLYPAEPRLDTQAPLPPASTLSDDAVVASAPLQAPPPPAPPAYAKWAMVAGGVVLVGGLAWMALKPSPAPQTTPASLGTPPAQVTEDAHDDQAKAGALVGPGTTAVPPPLPAPSTQDTLAAPVPAPAPAAAAPAAVPSAAVTRPAETSKPAPTPAAPKPAAPKPQKTAPTLNDLLD